MAIGLLGLWLATRGWGSDAVLYPLLKHADLADGRPDTMEEGFAQAYSTELGTTVQVGDTLEVGVANGLSARTQVVAGSSLGVSLAHGTSVASEYYTHIFNGNYAATVGKMVLAGLAQAPDPALFMAPARLAGVSVRVERLKLGGTRRKPVVWAECTFVNERDKANTSGTITVDDLDAALRLGEVVDPRHVTREMAIAKLKEAKDLLDLGIYTAEQYDAEKAKYVPFITGTTEPPPDPTPVLGKITFRLPASAPYTGVTVNCRDGTRSTATFSGGAAVVEGVPHGPACAAWLTGGEGSPVSIPVSVDADLTCDGAGKPACTPTP